ncbi:hypothetical protein QE152_g38884 [Popillia japonica]|uniref:Uncharacterized protein n=1 Tax=Popillia japonica TaxID=7064 RepID=A0AAW1HV74_POPJA
MVVRALVWRYVSSMHRKCEESSVTEEDINEVKSDISAFRYEMLEILNKNGMDVSCAEKKEKAILGKKMKVWERRLMKDFKVAPINSEEMEKFIYVTAPENEDSLARFRRIAKMALLNSSLHKWRQVVKGACLASQIGHCNSEDSLKKQQDLRNNILSARQSSCIQQDDGNLSSDTNDNDPKTRCDSRKSISSLPTTGFTDSSCKCERARSNWKQLHSRLSLSDGVLSKNLKEREKKKLGFERTTTDYKNNITYNESDEEDIDNVDENIRDDEDERNCDIRLSKKRTSDIDHVYFDFEDDQEKYSSGIKKT